MKRPTRPAGRAAHPNARPARSFHRPGFREDRAGIDAPAVLYGFHPVIEALRNPRRVPIRLLATENAMRRIAEEKIELNLQPEIVRPGEIDRRLTPDAVHQGLLLEAEPLPALEIADLPERGLVLVLDQITDPHNVGAIVRTACAYAADAILTTERHSPAATGVLAKSASGGLEHVPIVSVRNLARGLEELAERGYLRVGFDSDASEAIDDVELRRPLALVLGAEGKGLRQKTREFCDVMARMEMPGAIRSLNVSNAAAIALHVATRRT